MLEFQEEMGEWLSTNEQKIRALETEVEGMQQVRVSVSLSLSPDASSQGQAGGPSIPTAVEHKMRVIQPLPRWQYLCVCMCAAAASGLRLDDSAP